MLNLSVSGGRSKYASRFCFSFDPDCVASLHTQVPEGFPQLCWCAGSTPAGYSVEHTHTHTHTP